MATTKSQPVTSPTTNPVPTSRIREDVPGLKNKIAELEKQVNEYKTKLDELRRAKATTVVKLEKEYVNTAAPGTNRPEKVKPCEKCDELERIIETERKSTAQLKKMIEQKETNKQQSSTTVASGSCSKCPDLKQLLDIEKQNSSQLAQQLQSQKKETEQERHAKEMFERTLELIQSELIDVKTLSEKLRKENQEYKNEFERMKSEHADKMADLCRREEEAKKQVATWEQMYREWMATMERRVNNLQVTNEELQTWLQDENEPTQEYRPGGTGTRHR